MAITYPIEAPDDILGVAQIDIMAMHSGAISRSPFTLQGQVQNYSGQLWAATVTVGPNKKDLVKPWSAFLLKLKGRSGTFNMGFPDRRKGLGGPFSVNGGGQTGSVLNISGAPANTNSWLVQGDYIETSGLGSKRVHKVLNDVDTDGSGNASIDIWPNLRSSPVDGQNVFVSNARGIFRLSSNETKWSIDSDDNYSITFNCEEAF